jgi:hypothetical protein
MPSNKRKKETGMAKKGTPTTQVMEVAVKELERLASSSYKTGIIGAKAMEAAIKLTAQLCVLGLVDAGLTKAAISRELSVNDDKPGEWLAAKHTPILHNLVALIKLYRDVCKKDYYDSLKTEPYTT